MTGSDKIVFGWREWVRLPSLGLPAIKAKIDTGARTSALHAFKIRPFKKNGCKFVRFQIHPLQKKSEIVRTCVAEVSDRRFIKDSGGHKELRYIVKTPVRIGETEWEVEISLTNRKKMNFRMLLGRTAMGSIVVDTTKSFLTGRLSDKHVTNLYKDQSLTYSI